MYLTEVLAALRRRWVIMLIGLGLTAGVGLWAADPPPRYEAFEVFAILPPQLPNIPNQLTGLRPSLAVTGAVVAQRLMSGSGRAQLRRAGVNGAYSLAPRNSGTVQTPEYLIAWVMAKANGPDEQTALRELDIIIQVFADELVRLQEEWDVAQAERITIGVLAAPSAALIPHSSIRALAGTGLAGFILTTTVALLWDRRRVNSPQPVGPDRFAPGPTRARARLRLNS
ncbi:hypothetical protein [Allorhizocola rhizosphaerae]|uniref:hypothetical protein n=1 Tax=Allorhizocola rhizosphaerae TaxID=1872709 RepID=UPI000E3E0A83|nr:hypothetical protein [Allorhizocola rhizosphaerae]